MVDESSSSSSFRCTLIDVEATEQLGAQLAHIAQAGDVIFLRGELGAGKTSLARGFLRYFFCDGALEVPSPSYLICFTYGDAGSAQQAKPPPPSGHALSGDGAKGDDKALGRIRPANGQPRLPGVNVLHLDPYRLPEGKVASLIDLAPAFERHICLIEWPERLGAQLVSDVQPHRLEITLGGIGPQACGREVAMRAVGSRWSTVLAKWSAAGGVDVALSAPTAPPSGADGGAPPAAGEASESTQNRAATRELIPKGDPLKWLVLGIESSCDDTGAAVVRGDGKVLGEVLASQAGVHECWGGVVPRLAQEAHREAIDATVDEALRRAGVSASDLTAIAVTVGPGLSLCLEVGVKKAIALSAMYQLPLVRCHHMEAHAMVTWLPSAAAAAQPPAPLALASPSAPPPTANLPAERPPTSASEPTDASQLSPDGVPPFPFLTLLVSGGHNMLVLTSGLGDHVILGSTLDDSIGEAFDKTARLLGINKVPGGPPLEKLARDAVDDKAYSLPAPLSKTRDMALRASCDFSYAGLKSAVRQLLETKLPPPKREAMSPDELHIEMANVAAAFQRVAVKHLAERTARALEWAKEKKPSLTCLVVAGGVAANQLVRSELATVAARAQLPMLCPPVRLCTDNGIMVAWTGMQRLRLGLVDAPLSASADADLVQLFVEVRPRWPLGPRDARSTTQQQQLSKRKQPKPSPVESQEAKRSKPEAEHGHAEA